MLHPVNDGDSWSIGEKSSEDDTIALLKKGCVIRTVVWGYPGWTIKSKVTYVQRAGSEYLRSDANAITKDNLDN